MLLRTVLLVLLGASLGLSATLGHYQAQVREAEVEETKQVEVNPTAVLDDVIVAAEADAVVAQMDDAPAPEEVEAETLAASQPAVDDSEVDIPVGDGATADEPEADGDMPAGDALVGDATIADTPAEDTPAADTPAEDTPAADTPAADTPEADAAEADTPVRDTPAADTPAEDTPAEDTPIADTPEADIPVADTPVADTAEANAPADDTPVADTPEADTPEADTPAADTPAEDTPADDTNSVEALIESLAMEAASQEQVPLEEETNEITPVEASRSQDKPPVVEESSWSFSSIRGGFQAMHGYFDSMVELVGGRNGVCQYRCRYGEIPKPRPGYQLPEPNGCSSSLVGMQLDLGIPAMTSCCNQLDLCYDTCGTDKYECDAAFHSCVLGICSDLRQSLGFVSQVQACDSMADILHNTVWTLGCRSYMDSQRAACICEDEERDEL